MEIVFPYTPLLEFFYQELHIMMFSNDYLAHFKLNFQLKKESVEYFLSATTVHVAFEAVSKLHVEDLSYLLRICLQRT